MFNQRRPVELAEARQRRNSAIKRSEYFVEDGRGTGGGKVFAAVRNEPLEKS